jgi:Flp pilus assembly protein TadG
MTQLCRDRGRRGISLIFTAISLVFIIPLVGLVIDAGVLYTVKTKLQMAVDAGALAAARALSRGLDGASQQASARTTARAYVLVNFPTGYFNIASPVVPDNAIVIDESVTNQRSVTVTAGVTVPLYFMRWLGTNTTGVNATATAVRRDVNVVIVMDRSGSLANSGSCDPLKAAAVNFVGRFSNGRDNIGLVTFASSSMNDFPAATNFGTASPTVPTILNSITCTGGTNSAQGLYQGYSQLATLQQPNALNVILFFTDGYPTAITALFPIQAGSSCTSKTAKTAALSFGGTSPWGLMNQVATAQPMSSDLTIGPPGNTAGCAYASSWNSSATNVGNDIQSIPKADIYGNAMNTNYQPVTYTDGTHTSMTVDWLTIQNASVNAADSMGFRIRSGATVPAGVGIPNVHVYCIGLGNSGGVPDDFLERVANDARASNYDSTKPTGFYIYSPTAADLTDAFDRIASEILHLSK